MYEQNFETQTRVEDKRSPEEIEAANQERANILNGMYSHELIGNSETSLVKESMNRPDIDERTVFGALDDKSPAESSGVEVARENVAAVYDAMYENHAGEIAQAEQVISSRVEDQIGEAPDAKSVVARVGAGVLESNAEGELRNEQTVRVERAVVGADLLGKMEESSFDEADYGSNTVQHLNRFSQTILEKGGVNNASNADLEEAGKIIELTPEVVDEIDDEPLADFNALATAIVDKDDVSEKRESRDVPDYAVTSARAFVSEHMLKGDMSREQLIEAVSRDLSADASTLSAAS